MISFLQILIFAYPHLLTLLIYGDKRYNLQLEPSNGVMRLMACWEYCVHSIEPFIQHSILEVYKLMTTQRWSDAFLLAMLESAVFVQSDACTSKYGDCNFRVHFHLLCVSATQIKGSFMQKNCFWQRSHRLPHTLRRFSVKCS